MAVILKVPLDHYMHTECFKSCQLRNLYLEEHLILVTTYLVDLLFAATQI